MADEDGGLERPLEGNVWCWFTEKSCGSTGALNKESECHCHGRAAIHVPTIGNLYFVL